MTYRLWFQVHPDARSFRIKTIPYYRDLCLIYGDTAIEERSRRCILDTNVKSELGLGAVDLLGVLNSASATVDAR